MTARVRVHYPLELGRLVLRTDGGWDEDLGPADGGASHFDFCIRSDAPFVYFKPVVLDNGTTHWAVGANYLALTGSPKTREIRERIADEPKRAIRIYLDSGWPHDNYEATRNMRALLRRKGYVEGRGLFYLGFPDALHNETHWAMRCHVPFQFFFDGHR